MSPPPAWLPDIVPCDGDWAECVHRLYATFVRDFTYGRPRLRGRAVWWDRRKLDGDPYEEGFWHLISRDDPASEDRVPDFRRGERLAWCRATLDHATDTAVLQWNFREGSERVRTYLWVKDQDFVVVLEERPIKNGTCFFLITAYHLDGEASRRGMQRRYDRRLP
jgi:hypothetical protein